jgi:hypothetical protein
MSDIAAAQSTRVLPTHKHFWIKVASPDDAAQPTRFGTLICEDGEDALIAEAREFINGACKTFGDDWIVRITRPGELETVQMTTVAAVMQRA